jgi:hypothetical protein
VTIAERFAKALSRVDDPGLTGPELLPTRLARAAADTLEVDGAGLSLRDPVGRRLPLGASDDLAACAERLQFTAGAGPCAAAQESRQPVFALLDDLRRRWPAFAGLLLEHTPFRAVVSLPLPESLSGNGAMNLLFTDPSRVPELDVFDALGVGSLVASTLAEAAVWSTWPAEEGPAWLHGPGALRRAAVWEALGLVGLQLEADSPAALAVLRAAAYSANRSVDDLAVDLLRGRLRPEDLRPLDRG